MADLEREEFHKERLRNAQFWHDLMVRMGGPRDPHKLPVESFLGNDPKAKKLRNEFESLWSSKEWFMWSTNYPIEVFNSLMFRLGDVSARPFIGLNLVVELKEDSVAKYAAQVPGFNNSIPLSYRKVISNDTYKILEPGLLILARMLPLPAFPKVATMWLRWEQDSYERYEKSHILGTVYIVELKVNTYKRILQRYDLKSIVKVLFVLSPCGEILATETFAETLSDKELLDKSQFGIALRNPRKP